MKEQLQIILRREWESLKRGGIIFLHFLRWGVISCAIGAFIGAVGAGFYFAMQYVTDLRGTHPFLLYFLPLAGLVIALLYELAGESKQGTNLVLASVREEGRIPFLMAPLIFISTILTHMFGGSAGREGAALQLGGSIAQQCGRFLHMKQDSLNIITLCGMSACFAALFGTPVAAAIFCLEVVSVGVMYYSALVPCVLSSVTASYVASLFGIKPESFHVEAIASFDVLTAFRILALGALCALVSILFCRTMHTVSHLASKIKNPYLRIFIGGCIFVALTLLLGTRDYTGAGIPVIEQAMEGIARPEAFLLKILLTAVTLGFGYKGGEIVPSFFVGATYGCVAGSLLGLPPAFAAAIGLSAVFCGVTNCPIASLLIACELFGFSSMPYFLIAIAVSYLLSGYYGLYSTQKIVHSKYKPEFINIHTK